MTQTYPRCICCGGEPAPILDDRPEAYNRFGRHVGACYCAAHVPAGVPTVQIVADANRVYFLTRDATGEIVQDDRP